MQAEMNRVRRTLLACGLLLLPGCGSGDKQTSAPRYPDVLLITIDTLRTNHLSLYGYELLTSPKLDRLARDSAVFEIAYAPMGATSPAHATLFTSRSPLAHGVVRNGLPLLDEELSLTRILGEHGYRSAAFVSAYPVGHQLGFAQGFDHFDDHFEPAHATFRREGQKRESWAGLVVEGVFDRRGGETARRAREWLEGNAGDAPLFVWVHLFDPHRPYEPPEPFASLFTSPDQDRLERATALYDSELRYTDEQASGVVDAFLSVAPAGLVVITADHGEGLGDHGNRGHNRDLYDEELRVPLLVHWPGHIPPSRILQPAHLIDVAPTLLGLLGLPRGQSAFDGLDLSPHLRGEAERQPERPLWLQRPFYPDGRRDQKGYGFGVRSGPWKLIEAPDEGRRELYNLEQDPTESRDLSAELPERVAQLSERLEHWRRGEVEKAGGRHLEVSTEHREALDALGYLD